jgi:ACS family hexuronate transporter-like MFS transporter
LTISQRILSRQDRTLGNGILQSGAAVGAILTPLVVQVMMGDDPASWRGPFQVIGALGIFWVIGWFLMVPPGSLDRPQEIAPAEDAGTVSVTAAERHLFIRRLLVLFVVVIVINLCWQYFRAWLPKFLRESHDYSRSSVNYFIMGYYLATDVGSLWVGWAIRGLARRGWRVHSARLLLFSVCAALTSLSVVAAWLPAGWPLLAILCIVGFGALGLFPNYYSFSQELTTRHQGKLTGILGCTTWIVTGLMQPLFGRQIDQTQSYATGLMIAGLVPLIGCAALVLFWGYETTVAAPPDETAARQATEGSQSLQTIQAASQREGIVDSRS